MLQITPLIKYCVSLSLTKGIQKLLEQKSPTTCYPDFERNCHQNSSPWARHFPFRLTEDKDLIQLLSHPCLIPFDPPRCSKDIHMLKALQDTPKVWIEARQDTLRASPMELDGCRH